MKYLTKLQLKYFTNYLYDYSKEVDKILEKFMNEGEYIGFDSEEHKNYILIKYHDKIFKLWNCNKPYAFLRLCEITNSKLLNSIEVYDYKRPSVKCLIKFIEWLESQGYKYYHDDNDPNLSHDGVKNIDTLKTPIDSCNGGTYIIYNGKELYIREPRPPMPKKTCV